MRILPYLLIAFLLTATAVLAAEPASVNSNLEEGASVPITNKENVKIDIGGYPVIFDGVKEGTATKDSFKLTLSKPQKEIRLEGGPNSEPRATNIPSGSVIEYKDGILKITPPGGKTPAIEASSGSKVAYKKDNDEYQIEAGKNPVKIGEAKVTGKADIHENEMQLHESGEIQIGKAKITAQNDLLLRIGKDNVQFEGDLGLQGYSLGRTAKLSGSGTIDPRDLFIDMEEGKFQESKVMIDQKTPYQVALLKTNHEIDNGVAISFGNIEGKGKDFLTSYGYSDVTFYGDIKGKVAMAKDIMDTTITEVPFATKDGRVIYHWEQAKKVAKWSEMHEGEVVRITTDEKPNFAYYLGGPISEGTIKSVSEKSDWAGFSRPNIQNSIASFTTKEEETTSLKTDEAYERASQYSVREKQQTPNYGRMKTYFESVAEEDTARLKRLGIANGLDDLVQDLNDPKTSKAATEALVSQLSAKYGTSNAIKDRILDRTDSLDGDPYFKEMDRLVDAETALYRRADASRSEQIQSFLDKNKEWAYSEKGQTVLSDPNTYRALDKAFAAVESGSFEQIKQASKDLKSLGLSQSATEGLFKVYLDEAPPKYGEYRDINPKVIDVKFMSDAGQALMYSVRQFQIGGAIDPETIGVLQHAAEVYGPNAVTALAQPKYQELAARVLAQIQEIPEDQSVRLNALGLFSYADTESKTGNIDLSGVPPFWLKVAGLSMEQYQSGVAIPTAQGAMENVMTADPNKHALIYFAPFQALAEEYRDENGGLMYKPADEALAQKFRNGLTAEDRSMLLAKYNTLIINDGSKFYNYIDSTLMDAAKDNPNLGKQLGGAIGYSVAGQLDKLSFTNDVTSGKLQYNFMWGNARNLLGGYSELSEKVKAERVKIANMKPYNPSYLSNFKEQ